VDQAARHRRHGVTWPRCRSAITARD
jgi:hypothetical protein